MIIYLAPIRGITDSIYRNTFMTYFGGIHLAIAPFVTTVQGNTIKPSHIKDLVPEQNQSLPIIPQILSNDPKQFILLCRCLYDIGYQDINWNLGCPFPMVANKQRGSGLLPFPERIQSFLDQVITKIDSRLSIKTRLGRFHRQELDALIPIWNTYPISEIIIHARTGIQMYEGQVDLDAFKHAANCITHPVVYNGDILTYQDFIHYQTQMPTITRWMIGRGLLMNPFLANIIQSNGTLPDNPIPIFKAFHDDLFIQYEKRLYGASHILGKMKGLWNYFINFFSDSKRQLKNIHKSHTISAYFTSVDSVWNGCNSI